MTQTSPLAAPAVWNTVAEGYTAELLPMFTLYSRDALALARLPPRAHVLDVAAGPGTLSLLAAGGAERVVAVDFAEAMVEVLRRRASEAGLANVEVLTGDGQALPFPDGSFDGAFSMFGLMFFPDRAAGFRELLRVLRPGGRAVVSSWAPLEEVPLLASLFGAVRSLLPDLPSGGGKAPLTGVEELREEMSSAGFHPVEVHTVEHRAEAPGVRAFWESQARASAPLALLRGKLSTAEWEALAADVVARLEGEFGTGPLSVGWPARLGVGVR